MQDRLSRPEPRRRIIHADALAWMDANPADEGVSVVTSLPDVSESVELGRDPLTGAARPGGPLGFDEWKRWFGAAVRRIMRWIPEGGVAIFFQSDVRRRGVWIDKGYLVMRAAEEEGASLVWHKIVCRKPPGTIAVGRASYSHMICLARTEREAPRRPGPDVLPDAGFMGWSRAMGVEACRVACRFLRDETETHTVVDPFCGKGTVLAVANAMGFDAVGVELSAKRCRAARTLVIAATALASLLLLGCAPSAPASPASAASPRAAAVEDGRVEVSPLALRLDQVRRLREAEKGMGRDHPKRHETIAQLADALADLAALHREAAVAADAKVASLPPPRDARARPAGEEGSEIETDEAPPEAPPGGPVLARDEAAMAALTPVARAHLLASDRSALEACAYLSELANAQGRARDRRRPLARRARLLVGLGQRTEARNEWYWVLRTTERDALSVEAWLFFAEAFAADDKRQELAAALAKARDAASGADEPKLIDEVCRRAHAWGVHDVPDCALPARTSR